MNETKYFIKMLRIKHSSDILNNFPTFDYHAYGPFAKNRIVGDIFARDLTDSDNVRMVNLFENECAVYNLHIGKGKSDIGICMNTLNRRLEEYTPLVYDKAIYKMFFCIFGVVSPTIAHYLSHNSI